MYLSPEAVPGHTSPEVANATGATHDEPYLIRPDGRISPTGIQDMTTTFHAPASAVHSQCLHNPPCPSVQASDRDAAHVLVCHPEQGWSLLCNGIVLFEDFGELLPDGQSCGARRRELLMASPHRRAS